MATAGEQTEMRVAYFDPFCGLSGEMIVGALLDAGVPLRALRAELAGLNLHGMTVDAAKSMQEGVCGTYLQLVDGMGTHDPSLQIPGRLSRQAATDAEGQAEGGLNAQDLARIVLAGKLSPVVKQASISVLRKMVRAAGATSVTSGATNDLWSFDTLVQIVGTSAALTLLGVERVECAPVPLEGNTPEQATAGMLITRELLQTSSEAYAADKPSKGNVTAVGIAIMVSISSSFGRIPMMRIDSLGYGAANTGRGAQGILRVVIGEAGASTSTAPVLATGIAAGYSAPTEAVEDWDAGSFSGHQYSGRSGFVLRSA